MKSMVCASFALLALCAPATSAADDIYKSTMRDGTVRYGEFPEYGAKQVKKIRAAPISTGTIVVTTDEKEKGRALKPEVGGAAVLTQPPRTRPRSVDSGTFEATQTTLPSRTY